MKGYIHLYTGNGKGKTTAAFGLALRAVGAGKQIFIAQFVKGMHYSELDAIKRFPEIELKQYGLDCFIVNEPTQDDIDAARVGLEEVLKIIDTAVNTNTLPIDLTTPSTDTTKPIIWPFTKPPRWPDISPTKSPAKSPPASEWWDDSASTMAFTLPLSSVNQAGMAETYKRSPECLVEMQQPVGGASNVLTRTSSFVITARGFGPEVAEADSKRSRPQGSEVWLQSHIQTQ